MRGYMEIHRAMRLEGADRQLGGSPWKVGMSAQGQQPEGTGLPGRQHSLTSLISWNTSASPNTYQVPHVKAGEGNFKAFMIYALWLSELLWKTQHLLS